MFRKKAASKNDGGVGDRQYFAMDGQLRAYANRAMLFSFLSLSLAFVMTGFVIYAYMNRPEPLVVRVSESGETTVLNSRVSSRQYGLASDRREGNGDGPTEMQIEHILKTFLTNYLSHSPSDIEHNVSIAVNLMTDNLKRFALNHLKASNLVNIVKSKHITTDITIKDIEPSQHVQYAYTIYVIKLVRQLEVGSGTEKTDRLIGNHYIRLIQGERTVDNPYGLYVAEYQRKSVHGDRNVTR